MTQQYSQEGVVKQDGHWRIKIWCLDPNTKQPVYAVQNDLHGYWTAGKFYFNQYLAEKAMAVYKARGSY